MRLRLSFGGLSASAIWTTGGLGRGLSKAALSILEELELEVGESGEVLWDGPASWQGGQQVILPKSECSRSNAHMLTGDESFDRPTLY